MEIKKVDVFVIYARTGCTCCSYENHYRGVYKTREQAEARVKEFEKMPLLASQFARQGRYSIEELKAEILPDRRIIIENNYVTDDFYNPGDNDYLGNLSL